MNWIIEEHKTQGAVFGVRKMVTTNQEGALPIFDERIETPFGPAAGPNTQLAQNIVASYVAGSRFFELKTVQVMDGEELSKCVNKPCIVAQDECYNCEWSTELEVPQAFAEYVKAWFACHLIAREYGLGSPDGFVFNMSVGYDLEGIKSPKVDAYIEGMKDASGSEVWNECRTWALANLDKFEHVDAAFVESIPARVSNSITESTLHGCPPAEIERIATYLITEKGLNTYIKCNPTLLGYEFARQRLNELGFDYIVFDDTHFREDLQWADAVPMFERLIALCAERGLEFGVKLTNTFPVDVTRNELPSTEMYMSGRSLFSLTIEAARRITEQFDGKLRISYSGGATVYNIRALYDAGIWPVTLATDVLKPGGYERFSQMAGEFTDLDGKPFAGVSLEAVTAIQSDSLTNPLYKKPLRPLPDRKVAGKSPLPIALPRRAARAAPSSRIFLPIWRLLTRAATRTHSTSSSSATPCRSLPAPSARIPAAVPASVRSTNPRAPRFAPASSRPPARPWPPCCPSCVPRPSQTTASATLPLSAAARPAWRRRSS